LKRKQTLEEEAAKTSVKLVFPLVLFIFPSIMLVTIGPAMITILKTLPELVITDSTGKDYILWIQPRLSALWQGYWPSFCLRSSSRGGG